ncbi:MAG: Yip1 family protein [Candidatus Bathyarchaeota archaeon]|nr:Yip1 family protein [Candidatus Bathyarchaeota archaeon]
MEKTVEDQKPTESAISRVFTRIGGVLLAPESTYQQVIANKISFWEPLIIVLLLIGVQTAVVVSFCYRAVTAIAESLSSITGAIPLGFFSFFAVIAFIGVILVTLVVWTLVALIAHIIARHIFNGQGSFGQLMKLYGYSTIPWSLQILGTVLFGVSWVLWPMLVFFHIVALFWIVTLMSIAVRQNYNIDAGKAFIASFVGPMTVWLIITGILWAWIWFTISSLTGGVV